MPKKKTTVEIPPEIREAFNEYGFADHIKLEDAVSTRRDDEFFAILFPNKDEEPEGAFFAVTFNQTMEDWEVQCDNSGPFETIKEFDTEVLKRTFI